MSVVQSNQKQIDEIKRLRAAMESGSSPFNEEQEAFIL
jgi:hypothetical protein